MTSAVRTLRLMWPREITPAQLDAAMRLLASHGSTPLVVQALGQSGRVEHRLTMHEGAAAALTTQLRATLPGLGVEGVSDEQPLPEFNRAISIRLSTARRPLRADQIDVTTRRGRPTGSKRWCEIRSQPPWATLQ